MNKPTIVFLDASTLGEVPSIESISSLGNYTSYNITLPHERITRLTGCTIVITNKVIIDREVIDACPTIKLVCIAATGMNNVDLEYAAQKNIIVKNVAGYSTESVAQFTFSALFYLMHQLAYYDEYVKSGNYVKSPIFTHHVRSFWQLSGKRFGIIGLGNIGKRVAALANAFNAEVVYRSTSGKNKDSGYTHLSLTELLQTSDVVSIHCPLNEITTNLLGAEQLQQMKPTAFLLNMGRGGIVNEGALAHAIDSRTIAGAAVDVLTREPILESNPLMGVKRKEVLLITPHIAWASIEARSLLVDKLVANIREFLK